MVSDINRTLTIINYLVIFVVIDMIQSELKVKQTLVILRLGH